MTTATERSSSVLRHATIRFVVASLVALALAAAATVLLSQPLAEQLAVREASSRSTAYATAVVAPLVDARVLRQEPDATATLARFMRSRMADGSITHMKIWTETGRVVWSDEPAVNGSSYELDEDVASLFGTTAVTAEVSELDKAENAQERGDGRLIEVYVGFHADDGSPLVFEAYWPTERIQQDVGDIRWRFTGLGLGALLVLAATLLPLALSLARRVDRGLAEREAMVRHALSASDLERRRIAEDLHDGIVQDIIGLRYSLPTVAAAVPAEATGAREVLDRAQDDLARGMVGVRHLLTDLYPADLERGGLTVAVEELAERLRQSGTVVDVRLDPGIDGDVAVARLTYRVVREGLRNVTKHAHAQAVQVVGTVEDGRVCIEVRDDGRGLGEGGLDAAVAEGHLGLRLLEDTLRTLGGTLLLTSPPEGGTTLVARFPLALGADTD
ncbi:histidine kinase [Terrabacter sp. NPDC000476]|uniref:sensor histidine kinase n=1 Tax=Terrabacter sp. NPDC000476 TaxID=3154258 RepID=UPI0033166114